MKLLAVTGVYGDRTTVRFGYHQSTLMFAAPEPAPNTLLCIELPGLQKSSHAAVIAWLSYGRAPTDEEKKRAKAASKKKSRKEINELPPNAHRKATLDDFIDGEYWQYATWQIHQHFSAEEVDAFAERWVPKARAAVAEALAAEPGRPRVKALRAAHPLAERVYTVLGQAPRQMQQEAAETMRLIEEAELAEMRRGAFDVDLWLKCARRTRTEVLVNGLLIDVANHIEKTKPTSEDVLAILGKVRASKKLRERTQWAPLFWTPIGKVLTLEPNVEGEEIDISKSQEMTVQLGWSVLEARRVGRIVHGRTALVSSDGKTALYVRGERKLKFRVARAGGRLERMKNTLLVAKSESSATTALLEVDRLDTLAHVDPRQALAAVEDRDLPQNHPVFLAAEAAEVDPRQSRVLADLLIELVVGIDADIARDLARQQACVNRC